VSGLRAVHVVVPARNEEQLIGRCLDALSDARTALRAERPTLEVRVTVVLEDVAAELGGLLDVAAGDDFVLTLPTQLRSELVDDVVAGGHIGPPFR